MGKRLKIFFPITVIVLYCFFISFYNGTVVTSNSHISNFEDRENFTSTGLSNHIHDAEQTESFINICINIPRTTLKNSFNQFSALPLSTIPVINNSSSFYILYSENLFIRFSKTDIIFPFHNFW